MAKVVNRTRNASVQVYGTDTAAGADTVFELPPGRQTADTFVAREVRAIPGGAEIFRSQDWWAIHTDYVFVDMFDDGVFWDDLSLHCVPFAAGGARWNPGSTPAAANAARDALGLTPGPALLRATLEHPAGPNDGELKAIPKADFAFGIQSRTTIGDVTYISVRFDVSEHRTLNSSERQDLADGVPQARWKKHIEDVWARAVPSGVRSIKCEADWSGRCPHYTIRVHPNRTPMGFPRTYTGWNIELDPASETLPVCAHEFGHHLGLDDGYVIDLEVPYLIDDPQITALLNGRTLRVSSYWTYLDRLFPNFWLFGLGKRRALKRLAGGRCSPPGDIMDDQYARDGGSSGLQIIDAEIVEAILERRAQGLCFATRQFDPKYVN